MLAIASFTISCIAIFLPGWILSSRLFPGKLLPGALFYLGFILFQITCIELILGITQTLSSTGVLIASLVWGSGLTWFSIKSKLVHSNLLQPSHQASSKSDENFESNENFNQAEKQTLQLNRSGILSLTVLAFILTIPLISTLAGLLIQIWQVHPLSWDVVSYHLPNVLDYIQTASFWTHQSFFNQYPAGNEILQIWSFLPLKQDLLLGITTATLGLGILLTATLLLKNILPAVSPFEYGVWTIVLWVLCLAIPSFQDVLFDLGRNDITIAFWELLALWALQQSTLEKPINTRWLLIVGVSLGIAVGIKPTGLFYFTGFLGLVFSSLYPAPDPVNSIRSKVLVVLKFLILPTVVIGGFWYVRNLIQMGALSDQTLTRAAAELSIFRSLLNPGLYQINFPFVLLLLCLGITLLTTGICFWNRQTSTHFKLLTGFNWVALIALILTPSGAGYWAGDTPIFLIQIRYGIAIVPVSILLLLVIVAQQVEQLKSQHPIHTQLEKFHTQSQSLSTFWFLGVINGVGTLLLMVQFFAYQPPIGLPGFDSVLFGSRSQPSQIYAWTQKNLHNTVIYSIGLRPYGLYGFPFSNRVISRLGSSDWTYQEGLDTLRANRPEFIAISRDPFSRQVPKDIAFLINQPNAFEVVYQDPLAAVFRVTDAGQALADKAPKP